MKHLFSHLPKLVSRIKAQAGFTMIELLIVISILGILAVAVLSAINPIEQINRGRDTGSQSDAEQFLSAADRYYAYNGTYPWQGTAAGASDFEDALAFSEIDAALAGEDYATPIVDELLAKDELKSSYTERIVNAPNPLFIYNGGATGNSTYVCFAPQSKAFKETADSRCGDANGAGLPADLQAVGSTVCAGYGDPDTDTYHCLP